MDYQNLLQTIGLILVALLLVSCGVSQRPSVAGILTDQATGEPLVGARVVLCQSTEEGNCTLQPQFTAVTSSEGAFHITVPEEEKYVVLYNAGKTSDEWDGLKISLDQGPTVVHGPKQASVSPAATRPFLSRN
jgi:hypothetical protein